jgi:hypothetical protein
MQRPEQAMHKDVAKHIRARGVPGLVWWHTQNGARYGGKNPAMHGAIMKSLGVRAGVSDFVFLYDGRFYALELKAIGGGNPTEEQQKFIADVNAAGGFAVCAKGLDLALKVLEAWGLVKGAAQ